MDRPSAKKIIEFFFLISLDKIGFVPVPGTLLSSVAEPPLFRAAPAPEGRLRLRPNWLRLQMAPTPALYTKMCHFELLNKSWFLIMQVFYWIIFAFINCSLSPVWHKNKTFLFSLPKRCSRSHLKKAAPASPLKWLQAAPALQHCYSVPNTVLRTGTPKRYHCWALWEGFSLLKPQFVFIQIQL